MRPSATCWSKSRWRGGQTASTPRWPPRSWLSQFAPAGAWYGRAEGRDAVMMLAMIAAAAAKSAILSSASGTEPFWGLTIDRRTMLLDDASLERKIRARTPKPQVTRTGATYSTPTMIVRIRHEGCND